MKKLVLIICIAFFGLFRSSAAVSLVIPHMSGLSGTQITVPVKVVEFYNIVSMQGTIQFNPAVISFVSIQDLAPLPGFFLSSFNTTSAGSGLLMMSWFEPQVIAQSIADSGILFTITFNIIGSTGQSSSIGFVNSPTLIEIVDHTLTVLPYTLVNGSVTVTGVVGAESGFIPAKHLAACYPNPFSESFNMAFDIPRAGYLSITITDAAGSMRCRTENYFEEGPHILSLEDVLPKGARMPAGVYICTLRIGEEVAAFRLVRL